MRQFGTGQMAEQHAMAVQRALRLAGGAGGVDHHRRIVGAGIDRCEVRRRACEEIGEVISAVARPIDREHACEAGHLRVHVGELG
jgi:hypothetical protein